MPTTASTLRERVLVIDDEEAIRTALVRAIARGGYESFTACDGMEGLAQAVKVRPQVIIVDLRMPKMDGHTFLRRLAALDLDSAVIVSSADGEMDDVIEVMRNGAIDYAKKPWSPSNVLSAIARALEVYAKRVALRGSDEPVAAEPVGVTSNAPTSAPPGVEPPAVGFSGILERIKRGEILLPSPPKVVQELRQLITERDCSIERVTKLVSCDQALTARVLHLGHSAMYAATKPDQDLTSTLGRIGLQALHAIVETVWLNGCFQSRDPRFVPYAQRLCRFSVARAIAARHLAVAVKLPGSPAYYSGLFADVGASFLLHVIVEKVVGTPPSPEAVLDFVRIHHESVGAMLLKEWGHNEAVTARARSHHQSYVPPAHDRAGMLGIVATGLAQQLTGEDDLTGEMPTADHLTRCGRGLALSDDERTRLASSAAFELEAVLDVL